MSELFDKQVSAQKEKNFRGSHKLLQTHEKVCDENETRRKKRRMCKNVIDGRKPFIRCLWKGHVMDISEFQVNDS